MKKLLSTIVLLVSISLVLTNCEKESFIDTNEESANEQKQRTERGYITSTQIPEIINAIMLQTGDNSLKISPKGGKSLHYKKAIIDLVEILKVKNNRNISNYTFNITIEGAPINEFYNLVVTEKDNGYIKKPYVVKYVVDEDALEPFLTLNGDFSYFKGTRQVLTFNSFFKNLDHNFTKASDPCDGDITPIDNTNLGSSGDLGSIDRNNYLQIDPYSYNYGTDYWFYMNSYLTTTNESTYYGSELSTRTPAVAITVPTVGITISNPFTISVIPGTAMVAVRSTVTSVGENTGGCSEWKKITFIIERKGLDGVSTFEYYDVIVCVSNQKSGTITKIDEFSDPCDEEGEVGVVAKTKTAHITNFYLDGRLNQEQVDYLDFNSSTAQSINNFLDNNRDTNNLITQQAKDFAVAAIVAWMSGGEVDFNNEIIKDKSFIGTKADCVLKALINSGNNLFKKTSEAFTDGKSEYRIRFTTYNNPSDQAIARTGLPDSNGIISIEFNQAKFNDSSIYLANHILHETIHAELHRIKLTNNAGPNPLPVAQYNWYLQLWDFYENVNIERTATTAEHYYMANYFINPIASGLREFDQYAQPLENYKYFAWTGLQDYGKNAGYISNGELSALANLAQSVVNDTHINPCD